MEHARRAGCISDRILVALSLTEYLFRPGETCRSSQASHLANYHECGIAAAATRYCAHYELILPVLHYFLSPPSIVSVRPPTTVSYDDFSVCNSGHTPISYHHHFQLSSPGADAKNHTVIYPVDFLQQYRWGCCSDSCIFGPNECGVNPKMQSLILEKQIKVYLGRRPDFVCFYYGSIHSLRKVQVSDASIRKSSQGVILSRAAAAMLSRNMNGSKPFPFRL